MKRILIYIIIPLFLVLATACEDRLDYPGSEIPEGISTVGVEVGFKNFIPALDSRAAGDAIKTIETLWVVIYDKDGNFIRKQKITDFTPGKLENNTRPDGCTSSETQTGCAKFSLTLENGWYKMYAVANFDLSDKDVSTVEKLASLSFEWSEPAAGEDYTTAAKRNAQMFGYFTAAADKDSYREPTEDPTKKEINVDAPSIAIRGNSSSIHAWLRRAASKLTIAFDTQKLRDDVELYIKSITIKDIPKYCHIGYTNAPGQDNMKAYEYDGLTEDQRKELIGEGETIYFAGAEESDNGKDNYGKWRRIASGDSIYGLYSDKTGENTGTVKDRLAREHSEAAPALYFYENRQPNGVEHTVSDKRQDVSGDNNQISFPNGTTEGGEGWKDGMPFGTYVEVKGYYRNIGTARPGKGEIIYRFMLGKDTKINYDCERNHHYQLTMKFNGYANDVDFHIDYREEAKPGFFVQDTTYVSYLYNQESFTTIRATPREGYDLLSLESYIVENEWRPDGVQEAEIEELYNKSAWDKQVELRSSTNYKVNAGGYTRPNIAFSWTDAGVTHTVTPANNIEFGYLSLRKTRKNIYELSGSGDKGDFVASMRKLFFDSDPKSGSTGGDSYNKAHSKGYRDYGNMPAIDGDHHGGDATDGTYTISRKTNKLNNSVDYIMQVPLYTRARSIDSWAVYTGANPFYRHHRYARVGFVATYKKKDTTKPGPDTYQEYGETHVLQARRIDNPRGIYRRMANKDQFKVTLLYNMKTAAEQQEENIPDDEIIYDEIISRGGWTVSIENDPHELIQIEANGRTITGEGSSITGRSNTPISFVYTPRKSPANGESYGGTIYITYHNNSCSHRIVVRQGYYAHTIGPHSSIKWSAFNIYDGKNLTKSPLSIGSTFRDITNLNYPIKESNNYRPGFGVNKAPLPAELWIHGKDDTLWKDIPAMSDVLQTSPTWTLTNVHDETYSYRLPDYTEMPQIGIYTDGKNLDKDEAQVSKIGQAFGICYADGADGVLYTKGAYSYYDPENKGEDSPMGVRGVVVYSQENADNVFFPFGSLGHPRRRRDGLLQYGSVNWKLVANQWGDANDFRPMAYDLLHQVGGAYWTTGSSSTSHTAIDYNGGNYMSSYLNKDDVFQTGDNITPKDPKSDALPIKPIRTN